MTDEQLSALLRLKRHELPPPGYFDQLLRDVHRRQREELLRQPLWAIALERMRTMFGAHSMGSLSYAGAMAAVVILGVGTIGMLTAPRGASEAAGPVVAANATPAVEPKFDFQAPASRQVAGLPTSGHHAPRYVIDARPVSYDASSLSF